MDVHVRPGGCADELGTAGVIGVPMGEYDGLDLVWLDPDGGQIRDDLGGVAGQSGVDERDTPAVDDGVPVDQVRAKPMNTLCNLHRGTVPEPNKDPVEPARKQERGLLLV
jgi:hypothetical protein